MSQALRSFIQSAWYVAHPSAPVFVGDPSVPADSFLASPLDYANLDTDKSYPMCLVWNIKRLPVFKQNGYIENTYRVIMYVVTKCEQDEAFDDIQDKIDALRPSVDKLLSQLHINSGGSGISSVSVQDVLHAMDDNTCGHEIQFSIDFDEDSTTICQAPELIVP